MAETDVRGRRETGEMGSAMGGPNDRRTQSLQLPHETSSKGDPADVSEPLEERLHDEGVEVDHAPLEAVLPEQVRMGPTAGGG